MINLSSPLNLIYNLIYKPIKDDRPIWEKLGWKRVVSQSRPGQFSYENIYTDERIPDIPKYPACKEDGKSQDLALYD